MYIFGNNNKLKRFTIPAAGTVTTVHAGNHIQTIAVKTPNGYSIDIGTAPGGNDVVQQEEIFANVTRDITINKTFDVTTPLYFTGNGVSDSKAIMYKR